MSSLTEDQLGALAQRIIGRTAPQAVREIAPLIESWIDGNNSPDPWERHDFDRLVNAEFREDVRETARAMFLDADDWETAAELLKLGIPPGSLLNAWLAARNIRHMITWITPMQAAICVGSTVNYMGLARTVVIPEPKEDA